MRTFRLAFLGFGNVGRALAELFIRKEAELKERYQLRCMATGVATGRHGKAVNPQGFSFHEILSVEDFNRLSSVPIYDSYEFIRKCGADALFENTPVDYDTGEPAVSHLKTALECGMHAITANKGPVVHAYQELAQLARQHQRKFYFESTVMDGAPIFSLFRETLPGANLRSFTGVLNSTTNLILTRMEAGESFEEAVAYCQRIGIAETDPSGDIDGWDASVKVAALVTVLMGTSLKPAQVDRQGIRHLNANTIAEASREGKRWKLVCSARKVDDTVVARVAPELVASDSPLYGASGTTSIVQFETDVLGLLSVVEENPGPHTTAYGLFADFLNAVLKD